LEGIAYSASLGDTTTVTSALTQGTHYWRVKGENAIGEETEWSSVRSFLLDGPEAPGLINPTNDSLFIGVNTLTVEWNSSEFATLYEANVSITSDFASVEFEETTSGTALVTSTLLDNGKRYWRVRAQNSVGFWGDWSSSGTFFVSDVIIFAKTFSGIKQESDFYEDVEIGNSVQQTQDGGYIIAGTILNGGFHSVNVWLIKTNEEGNEEWISEIDPDEGDYGNSVQQTTDGGYIIAGSSITPTNWKVLLIKADANGSEEWHKLIGEVSQGNSVQQTSDGGYIITGYTTVFTPGGIKVIWLIKTDANGTNEWNKTFGGSENEVGFSVVETVDGGFIIAGHRQPSASGPIALLIKTDVNGNEEWSKEFEGSEIGFNSIQQSSDGGYILGGSDNMQPLLLKTDVNGVEEWRYNFTEFSVGIGGSAVQTLDGGFIFTGSVFSPSGLLLLKTDALGNEEWNKIYRDGTGQSVQQASDGGYIITGQVNNDVWLIKTDSEGNTVL